MLLAYANHLYEQRKQQTTIESMTTTTLSIDRAKEEGEKTLNEMREK